MCLVKAFLLFGFFVSCTVSVAKNTATQDAIIPSPPFKSVTTQHRININNTVLSYHATVGVMPISDQKNLPIATMSYIAYFADTANNNRPITFIWAGGPGCSSLSDNFLMSGPRVIDLNSGRTQPGLVDNPETWLQWTDLVYIDMVGSGWGRSNKNAAKTVFTPIGDAYTFSNFIENYLQQHGRLHSPIYLSGESYGGFRVPLVVNNLLKQFIPVKGIILLSPLLDSVYQASHFGDNTPYPLIIPTFIRTALYFHKLPPALQNNPEKTIRDGSQWAAAQYPYYLLRGDSLNNEEKTKLVITLSQYTGLSESVIRDNHFRISSAIFRRSLLSNIDKSLDLIDSRNAQHTLHKDYGFYVFNIGSFMSSQLILYPNAMNYISQDLGVKVTKNYINYADPNQLGWNGVDTTQVISILHDNLVINPKMWVFVGMGFYDTDVPYFATETAINQLLLPDPLQKNITLHHYAGGHMFYVDPAVKQPFFNDIKTFFSK
ncbi:MAG: hypothetical protein A3F12_05440 [Gammaproteobacteria bacterium RIFCSPHIGHO2_12_FULL_38_14]|nr:MAG: hypothetical protein A3F12_05440 [Gammaproteobacteria bacterium RIFCSPHIGHO2_12_FULL_38_14]